MFTEFTEICLTAEGCQQTDHFPVLMIVIQLSTYNMMK